MDGRKENWDKLAQQAQSGDKEAYHTLLSALLPYVRAIITPGLAHSDWVDDLLQDVLMGVHKSLARYMPGQPFRPWVNAIIRYRKAEFLGCHYNEREHLQAPPEEGEPPAEDALSFIQTVEDLERAAVHLPEQYREVFALLRIEGYSVKEVAEKLGMSESAVKVSAHRCAKKLREIMG